MQPKFAVGEVVILRSIEFPELNGERTVLQVALPWRQYVCPRTGRVVRNAATSVAYVLDVDAQDEDGYCMQWAESALRKRHTPGDYSFEDLKTVLHLPVTREEMRRVVREKCNG